MLQPVAKVWLEQKVSLRKIRKTLLAGAAYKWPEYKIFAKIPIARALFVARASLLF